MIQVQGITFNPFSENTYLLFDETKECVIIDPGCYEPEEERFLLKFIEENGLKPVRLLNTHCHIDHILGNYFVATKFNLKLEINKLELPILEGSPKWGKQYGINGKLSPEPEVFLKEGDVIEFGNSKLDILFVPGHAPGHLAFVSHQDQFVIGGDVLFQMGVGRTDLPFGDTDTLIKSIKEKLFTLPDSYEVYPGHGDSTSIGFEKKNNPYVRL